ncbi:MAG: hypothetical protein IAA89_04595 [Firmicutes bacterium]|uniref:Uncharacterized protein n=1 Tax=Candidatus Gallilactobacillus intestinavium TaxID=2840838 RepID=A0A9D9H9V2_9LACO|nr:hypothetical protein [Candidatus Gallilactobacillus intestinavium]
MPEVVPVANVLKALPLCSLGTLEAINAEVLATYPEKNPCNKRHVNYASIRLLNLPKDHHFLLINCTKKDAEASFLFI